MAASKSSVAPELPTYGAKKESVDEFFTVNEGGYGRVQSHLVKLDVREGLMA